MRQILPIMDNLPWWPVVAGSVFFALFILIVLLTVARRRSEDYKRAANSVLDNDSRSFAATKTGNKNSL